jgi:hypothetical protein
MTRRGCQVPSNRRPLDRRGPAGVRAHNPCPGVPQHLQRLPIQLLSPFLSTTFKVRGDKSFIFLQHSRLAVNLRQVSFLSHLFSSTFKDIPSF